MSLHRFVLSKVSTNAGKKTKQSENQLRLVHILLLNTIQEIVNCSKADYKNR